MSITAGQRAAAQRVYLTAITGGAVASARRAGQRNSGPEPAFAGRTAPNSRPRCWGTPG